MWFYWGMDENDFMARHDYETLSESADAGNELADSLAFVRELVSGMYPDTNRREPRIDDLEAGIADLEKWAANYVSAIRTLIEKDK